MRRDVGTRGGKDSTRKCASDNLVMKLPLEKRSVGDTSMKDDVVEAPWDDCNE